jgi:hypothetical protein
MDNNCALAPVSVPPAAYQKAALIQQALHTLQTAQQIDERDDLDAASFLDWYNRTIPDVQDIKILAGAMEIELSRRRGEQILQEGERRGGDTKLTPSVSLLPAEHMQRSRDRAVAAQPKVVDAYVQREVKAGRAPTVKGAVRMARIATNCTGPKTDRRQMQGAQTHRQATQERVLAVLTQVADGTRRTVAQLVKIAGVRDLDASFLDRVRLIPWLRIDRTAEGIAFHIDEELRAICDGRQPRPTLAYQSIDQFLRHLRTELTRKRKENRDERRRTKWDSRLILVRIQSDMLDWIEDQLDQVPTI